MPDKETTTNIDPTDDPVKDPVKDPANSLKELVDAGIAEALKPIKDKLDSAYSARDDALSKLAKLEKEKRDAELERLKAEGKEKEVYELKLAEHDRMLAEERAKSKTLEEANTVLSRDIELKNSLATLDFRNDSAMKMATYDIVKELVRNADGVWVHSSGVSIDAFVKNFANDSSNDFLFKPTQSSGTGTPAPTGTPSKSKKSLFEMSQADVLKLASEGKL